MSKSTFDTRHILKYLDRWTDSLPKILWIELTSKCPFHCFFCMRESMRHPGEHMDFALFQKIIGQLHNPEIIRLSIAGESIHYPRLIDAVRISKQTGARIELVTTLASAPMQLLSKLLHCNLDQLTISLHTVDPDQYQRIYGFASFNDLDVRLRWLLRHREEAPPFFPKINFSFVATAENLQALPQVSRYAHEIGIREIQIHRVICRDPDSTQFSHELHFNRLTQEFRRELEETVENTRRRFPALHLIYANNALDETNNVSAQPAFYAEDLPSGCRVADCIENPWETVNIFSNGDILACGCRPPQQALGNLNNQSLAEIWNGSAFQEFRIRYFLGQDEICRRCPWKKAFKPSSFRSELPQTGGWSWQLMRGWYHEEKSPSIWSKPEAFALLNSSFPRLRMKLTVAGLLPNPDAETKNLLEIICNGVLLGEVVNYDKGMLQFANNFPIPGSMRSPYCLNFKTQKYFCPSEHAGEKDIRKLGFALFELSAKGLF